MWGSVWGSSSALNMFIVTPYTRKLRDFNGTKQTLGFIEIPWFPPTEFMCVGMYSRVANCTGSASYAYNFICCGSSHARVCGQRYYIHSDFSLHSTYVSHATYHSTYHLESFGRCIRPGAAQQPLEAGYIFFG